MIAANILIGYKITIRELRSLVDGWDSYDAPAPDEACIKSALQYIDLLNKGSADIIHVGANNIGVGITLMDGKTEIVVMFLNE